MFRDVRCDFHHGWCSSVSWKSKMHHWLYVSSFLPSSPSSLVSLTYLYFWRVSDTWLYRYHRLRLQLGSLRKKWGCFVQIKVFKSQNGRAYPFQIAIFGLIMSPEGHWYRSGNLRHLLDRDQKVEMFISLDMIWIQIESMPKTDTQCVRKTAF